MKKLILLISLLSLIYGCTKECPAKQQETYLRC